MRNFVLGFVLAVVLGTLAYGVYWFTSLPKRYERAAEVVGDCAVLNPSAADFGKVGLTISSASGKSVAGREFALAAKPGVKPSCTAKVGSRGLTLFDKVPVGTYYIYDPAEDLQTTHPLQIQVYKDVTSEAGVVGE